MIDKIAKAIFETILGICCIIVVTEVIIDLYQFISNNISSVTDIVGFIAVIVVAYIVGNVILRIIP